MCDGECTHTPCRTHIFLTRFLCVTCRHRVQAWLKVFAVRMSYLSNSLSILMFHPSSFFPHGHFETTFSDFDVLDFLAELHPARKRGSCALPHERLGVWLPGRSHALHRSHLRTIAVDFCTERYFMHCAQAVTKVNLHYILIIKPGLQRH